MRRNGTIRTGKGPEGTRGRPRFPPFGPCLAIAAALGFYLLGLPNALGGQVVRGRLLDNVTADPVIHGTVSLLDSQRRGVATTLSDSLGRFELEAPRPGRYTIQAMSLGYRSGFPTTVDLEEEGEVWADIYLDPQPVEVDSILVEVEGRRVLPELAAEGFYRRLDQGFGSFLTPERIKRIPAISVGDLLRHAPFVYSNWNLAGSTVYVSRGGRRCVPSIYVDGMRISSAPDHWVNAEDVVAVEVYRGPSQIPLQWASFETCGLILIWTDVGGGGPSGPGEEAQDVEP